MVKINKHLIVKLLFVFFIGLLSCEKEPDSTLAYDMLYSGSGLRVGTAVANINPENVIGVNMEGYEPRQSTGINDTLSARCIIIADDFSVVALIALDLIGISINEINELKDEIKQATGLEKKNIFIHAIHTHSGPSMMDGKVDKNYLSRLYNNTSEATIQALKSMENVQAIVKSGQSNVATVNRRNPERNVENEFTIIEFQNSENKNVASMLNFGCHPVVLGSNNHNLTADYVHYLRKKVEIELGGTAVFFNGSFGNINPARKSSGNPYDRSEGTFDEAKNFGEMLANDMLYNYSNCDTTSVSIRKVTSKVSTFYRYTYISILDLGIIQIAMLPGEPLDLFGNEVKELLPGPYKIIVGSTNDYIGYLVPDYEWGNCSNSYKTECYEETVGGGKKVYGKLKEELLIIANELY